MNSPHVQEARLRELSADKTKLLRIRNSLHCWERQLTEITQGLRDIHEDLAAIAGKFTAPDLRRPEVVPAPIATHSAPSRNVSTSSFAQDGATRMMQILSEQPDRWFSREELAEAIQTKAQGSSFRAYLSTLALKGLVVKRGQEVKASPAMFSYDTNSTIKNKRVSQDRVDEAAG